MAGLSPLLATVSRFLRPRVDTTLPVCNNELMNNNTDTLTADTADLFSKLVNEHNDIWGTEWFYTPEMTKQERGNYTDLVKKGLIVTDVDDLCKFTEAGMAHAEATGQPIDTEGW